MWAFIAGELLNAEYKETPIFGLHVPTEVSNVPSQILDPATQWPDKGDFNTTLTHLATIYKVIAYSRQNISPMRKHPFLYGVCQKRERERERECLVVCFCVRVLGSAWQ